MRDGEPLDPLRARIAVPFVLTALIWGSTWLAIKDQLGDVPPSWSIAYRFVTAAVGMARNGLYIHRFARQRIWQEHRARRGLGHTVAAVGEVGDDETFGHCCATAA